MRAGTTSPPDSVTVRSVTASIVVFVRISIPRLRSSALGERRERRRDLGHHAVLRLDEHEAHAVEPRPRVALDHVGGEVLQLGEPLEPRVAGADEHEA